MTATAPPVLSAGIIRYMSDLTNLVTAHAGEVNCPTESLNNHIKQLMENSYRATLDHMVNCEVGRLTGVPVMSNRMRYNADSISFSMATDSMVWAIVSNQGVEINVNKAMNEIASHAELEPLVVSLSALVNSGTPDLLDFAKAKVEFMCKVYELAKVKVDQLQAIITTQEAA